MAATMRDIARQLGLSVVTVSRALRNYPDISVQTKKKVLELASTMRYRPDQVARSLVMKRTFVWGLMIPDLTHSFFVDISKGVDSVAAPENHLIIVDSEGDPGKEASEILTLLGRKIDGLIAAPIHETYAGSNFDVLGEEAIPYVLVDRLLKKHRANSVVCDNVKIGYLATDHLIRLGHQRIAHINCPGFEVSSLRRKGYRQALQAHHLKYHPEWIVPGGINEAGGYEAARRLMGLKPRVTAIFAINDRVAIGAMKAIKVGNSMNRILFDLRPRRIMVFIFILGMQAAVCLGQTAEARFMSYPDIWNDKVLFTWEDDLWLGSTEGGSAKRLTNHPGRELMAHFSPDGKWIAFSAAYHQVPDVYIMASEGGLPKRLTYFPSSSVVVGWTPDSRSVIFRSTFGTSPVSRDTRLYKVALDGSMPVLLPVDRGVSCSFSEDGKQMFYVRKGAEDYYWKRYKGGRYTDIWMVDLAKKSHTAVTDYVGKNAYPMWIGGGLYFGSDRAANGITNLFAMDLQNKSLRQVTQFGDFDVLWASTDHKNIVFIQGGYIHVLDPKSGKSRKLSFRLPTDDWKLQTRWINPSSFIQDIDIGNDGKSILLGARGDLFHIRTAAKETRAFNLSQTSGSRERYGSLSPDGKTVAFFSDRAGEYQLYSQNIEGGAWTALTDSLDRTMYHLSWSPDGKKILFGSKDFDLFFVDIASKKIEKIEGTRYLDNDEFVWEVSDYAWSPDSRWIAYSLPTENRNNIIYLYDTKSAKKLPLTDNFYENMNPRWDAAGGYLYFLSYRNFQIAMDAFEDDHVVANPVQVMAVQLRAGEKPPFAVRGAIPEEKTAEEKASDKKPSAENENKYRVDPEGIQARLFALPVKPGNYFHLLAGKGMAAWSSVEKFTEPEFEDLNVPQGETKWDFHIFSLADQKEVILEEKIARAAISLNGEQLLLDRDGQVYASSLEEAYKSKKGGKSVDLSGMAYQVVPVEEWNQIFNDAWRWYRDFFYDANMHGRDWKAMGEKYRAFLKDIKSREQLNWVLSEMVGELCVSHTYVSGGERFPEINLPQVKFTGLLGADLEDDVPSGLYRFSRIYGPTPYFSGIETPLARPDISVKEGDYLLAINGQDVKAGENYFRYLQVGKDEYLRLTVNRSPSKEGATTLEVKPLRSDREARYGRWVSDNIAKVLTASNGKVGYMHITAMGGGGIMQFDKFWRAFRYKDGLIIDVRGNGGGWTEYFMIDKLERQQVAFNVLKGMEPYRYPNPASRAHYVLVSNEDNGSDGEAFVEHFKARKLGTVVGVPSWGGLVGIVNAQKTIDNGVVQQSNNAFFGREGKWLVENHGADPDILQDNDPASVLSGKDLQLEKAVETALKKIKEQPWSFPTRPPYPKR